jgi:hypothetical protein
MVDPKNCFFYLNCFGKSSFYPNFLPSWDQFKTFMVCELLLYSILFIIGHNGPGH